MGRRSGKPTKAYRTQLVVGLTPALAAHLDDGTTTPDAAHLARLSGNAGFSLQAQRVRSLDTDNDAIVWYAATLLSDGPAAAEEVASALRDVHGVAAAYLKPPDSAP